mgnify:CR=1 FL=1
MTIEKIRKDYELIDLFCSLAEVPSPSMHEEKVAQWIKNYCDKHEINCKLDDFGNVVINIPATDSTKAPMMLSAHIDVIGDDSPVKTYLDENDNIHAEGRTLGGDDKAGVANALLFAKELVHCNMKHGGLEVMFTRDEENNLSGIRNANLKNFKSKYVLVLDSDTLGQCEISGASYTLAKVKVHSFKGGHSGIDIGDKKRANAAKLIADLISNLPQGVFYEEDGLVVTSCNIGGISAGDIKVTNIINTDAQANYSIRSSSRKKEEELKSKMSLTVDEFNINNKDIAEATIEFEEHLPPFEKVDDDYIPTIFEKAANKVGVKPDITSFHAGAETHIYANKTNANDEKFVPYLIGLATVCNMHSKNEYLEYKTILKGHELLVELFNEYNN